MKSQLFRKAFLLETGSSIQGVDDVSRCFSLFLVVALAITASAASLEDCGCGGAVAANSEVETIGDCYANCNATAANAAQDAINAADVAAQASLDTYVLQVESGFPIPQALAHHLARIAGILLVLSNQLEQIGIQLAACLLGCFFNPEPEIVVVPKSLFQRLSVKTQYSIFFYCLNGVPTGRCALFRLEAANGFFAKF